MKRTLPGVMVPILLAGGAIAAVVQVSMQLKPADHEQIGKALSAYYRAVTDGAGSDKALIALTSLKDKIDKRSKGSAPLLSMVRDLERSAYLADTFSPSAKKGLNTLNFEFRGDKYSFAVLVPKDYAPKAGPFPLLLCAPDVGKKPQEVLEQAWVDPDLRSKAIVAVCQMPVESSRWLELGSPGIPGGLDTAMQVLKHLRGTYAIDVNRTFVVGLGAGVPVAARLGALFPHVFAGAIGRAGDMDSTSAFNFRGLPTFWAGGGQNCTSFQEEAEKLGYKNCTVDPGATEQTLWAWVQSHPRDANPSEVRLSPVHAAGKRAYWLEVDRFDPAGKIKPHVEAVIDRMAGRITVTGEGVETVVISFNDILVDMSKPVEILLNGQLRKQTLMRNLSSMLDISYKSNDSGRIYTAFHTFDLPKPPKPDGNTAEAPPIK